MGGRAIEYVGDPKPLTDDAAKLGPGHPKLYNTLEQPVPVGTMNGR